VVEQQARLEIGSQGERSAASILQFLNAVTDSHDGLLAFLNMFDRGSGATMDPAQVMRRLSHRRTRPSSINEITDGYATGLSTQADYGPPPTTGLRADLRRRPPTPVLHALTPRDQRLQVVKIAVASPGIWEFLGALNPLTFINDFLAQRHERNKDFTYRNEAERRRLDAENRRLEIENEIQEVQLVRDRLQLAQALGISPEDQRVLLNRFAVRPLLELDTVIDRGMAFPPSAIEDEADLDPGSRSNALVPRIQ
jgi:hypothetical protein